MGWTRPRPIAKGRQWIDPGFDYDGPCCYLLGTGGPRGGKIAWHYIGETSNERKRITQYATHGSHLSSIIDWHLRQGWVLYYCAWALASKAAAVRMQDRMLDRFRFDWNIQLNGDD